VGAAHTEDVQYIRVFVGQLRAKIERDPAHPTVLITEPGVGYRLVQS
jgi:two-component system KDP operon response regulator KdpE